jgi:hypothetical protein
MRQVTMRHDGVEGEITVAPSAVSAMIRAGWEEVPEPPPKPPATPAHEQPGSEPGGDEPGDPVPGTAPNAPPQSASGM